MIGSFHYYCWAATDVGMVRPHNEDTFATSTQPVDHALSAWEGYLGSEAWAIVADGMAGHKAGEVASELAVECFRSVVRPNWSDAQIIPAVEATNLALYDAMQIRPDLTGMGTTIVGVLARGSSATVFNVGDSRAYLHSQGAMHQVSEDHVVGGNQLTRCLGGLSTPGPVQPYLREIPLRRGDKILLCTDGLSGELTDNEISACLLKDKPADALIEAANLAGGHDNITAVVIEVR